MKPWSAMSEEARKRKLRSFIAVPLPEDLRQRLAALITELRPRLPGVRWSRPETLHLTLRFLGDQTEETLEQIAVSMLSVGGLSAPFRVRCRGLGAFPRPRRARVLWLGLEPTGPLLELHRHLQGRLQRCGFPAEQRPFSPHLTLGRVRGRPRDLAEPLAPLVDREAGSFEVGSMVLYESRLRPEGALHLVRARAPLTRRDIY